MPGTVTQPSGKQYARGPLPAQHKEDGHPAYSSPGHSNLAETFGSGAALTRATAWKGPHKAGCESARSGAAGSSAHMLPSKAGIWERGLSWTQQERTSAAQSLPLGTPPQQRRDAGGGNLVEDCTHDSLRFSETSYEATQFTHSDILQVL